MKGYEGKERHWDGSNFKRIKEIRFAPNDTTARLFDEYLAKAKEEDIKVILVYAPQYIGVTNKTSNQAYMHEWYQQIADRYDFPILDYTYMEIFSDSLAHDLKRLLVNP